MTRRLPWATGTDAGSATKTKRTPVQRPKNQQPISSDDDPGLTARPHQTSSPVKSPSKKRVRKRETCGTSFSCCMSVTNGGVLARTPSTSPPPGPPPVEYVLFKKHDDVLAKPFPANRSMNEGYHADDIFMLVEDEFQTVAQSFTHHLHHAEYVRMKKKARAAPHATITNPLNSMSTEARKKLEAKEVHDRQDVAVKSMMSKARRTSPDNEEEPQGRDPWQGTSLAGLMTNDSTQRRPALVGLEPISSSTRAAKGFSRGEGDSPKKREENRSILEIYGGKTTKKRITSPTPGAPTEDSEEVDDDILDPRGTARPVLKHERPNPSKIEKDLNKTVRVDPSKPLNPLMALPLPPDSRSEPVTSKANSDRSRPSSKISSSSLRRTIDDFDGFHDEDVDDSLNRSSDFRGTGKNLTKAKRPSEKDKKDKKSRLDDIPTFLV